MPISLFSGLPGHGKTLRCLFVVEELRKRTGRPVYFHRINELKLDWLLLADPKRWMDVPDGSIVVIDEAHEVFPKRGPSAAVPQHVNDLATHRHRGIDIFLISQHAKNQLDHFVRGLIDGHQHMVRLFGSQRARVHKWEGLGDPDDYHSLKKSITETWAYPPQVFAWYKSAEVHTVQRRVPWKPILVISLGAFSVLGLGYLAFHTLVDDVEAVDAALASTGTALKSPIATAQAAAPSADAFLPSMKAAPFTAPFYAPAIKVTQAPQISGCGSLTINGEVDCWCHTQQGTRVELTVRECLAVLKSGAFRFDREDDYFPKFEPYVPPLAPPAPGWDGSTAPAEPSQPPDSGVATPAA